MKNCWQRPGAGYILCHHYKATWEDEKIVWGVLDELPELAERAVSGKRR
ncbi:MAG: hypothetical protein ACLUOI_27925 [Eisenbergiella sp.]